MPGHRNWYDLNRSPDNFHITLNPYPFRAMSVTAAADHAAQMIHSLYPNLWLAMSGGLDSEFVADVLLRNNIPFTPVIVQDPVNAEHVYARHWCRKNCIEPKLLEDLLSSDQRREVLHSLARRAGNPYTIAHLPVVLAKMAEKQGCALIAGTGECFNDEDYPVPMGDSADFYERDWLLEMENSRHPGAFLSYTPELMYALISNIDCTLPTQEAKSNLYGLGFRPKIQSSMRLTEVPTRQVVHSYGTISDLISVLECQLIA